MTPWFAVLIWLFTLFFGLYLIGRLAHANTKLGFAILGRWFLLVYTPAVILHELSHLIPALFLGHRIESINLKGAFIPGQPAYVVTRYQPTSLIHQIGRLVCAIGPILIPTSLGFVALWTVNNGWGGALLLGYLALVLSVSMNLSGADWRAALGSLLFTGPALACLVFILFPPPERLEDWVLMQETVKILMVLACAKALLGVFLSVMRQKT